MITTAELRLRLARLSGCPGLYRAAVLRYNGGMIKLILLSILSLLAAGCNRPPQANLPANTGTATVVAPRVISASQARRMMTELDRFVLIDVRTPGEFSGGRIAGAINVPVNEIGSRAAAVIPGPDTAVLLYCRSGNRSAQAARTLSRMGYTRVFDFGGILSWPYGTVR